MKSSMERRIMSNNDNVYVQVKEQSFPLSKSAMDKVIDKLILDDNFNVFAYFTSINAHGDEVEFCLDGNIEIISRSDAIHILTTTMRDAMNNTSEAN